MRGRKYTEKGSSLINRTWTAGDTSGARTIVGARGIGPCHGATGKKERGGAQDDEQPREAPEGFLRPKKVANTSGV